MYAYLEAESPPSGPCARLSPNSSNFMFSFPVAAILNRAAFVVMRLSKVQQKLLYFPLFYICKTDLWAWKCIKILKCCDSNSFDTTSNLEYRNRYKCILWKLVIIHLYLSNFPLARKTTLYKFIDEEWHTMKHIKVIIFQRHFSSLSLHPTFLFSYLKLMLTMTW